MKCNLLQFGLVLTCLPLVQSTVFRETTYEVISLTEELVHVDIRSQIPGTIRWTFTDDFNLRLYLNISSNNQEWLDDVSIVFNSNSSSCLLHIDSIANQTAAAATGSGTRNTHVIILIWLAMLIMEWRYMHVLIVLLLANGLVHCVASETEKANTERRVDIEIRAPRRFRYKDSTLVINGGHVRLMDATGQHEDLSGILCSPTTNKTNGLDACRGNDFCVNGSCLCDDSLYPNYNCSVKIRDDSYFPHPLDPRLVRTVTPSGDVITLSDISNSEEKVGKIRDPDLVYLDIKSKRDKTSVFFNSDGLLKRLQSQIQNITYTLQLKRSHDFKCKTTIVASTEGHSRLVYDIDSCDKNSTIRLRKPVIGGSARIMKNRRTRMGRRKPRIVASTTRISTYVTKGKVEYVDIPVTALRCASELTLDYNVVFEMKPYDITGKSSHPSGETILLKTNLGSNGRGKYLYLRLPANNIIRDRTKCKHAMYKKKMVCRNKYLDFYKQLWIAIAANTTGPNNSLPVTHGELYYSFLSALIYFCDTRLIYQPEDKDINQRCFSSDASPEYLFTSSLYFIRPRVTFADGKTVIGTWISISQHNLPDLRKNGIVVTDNKPEVRISKISVIPTDPVPQDIYQVRLDYTCATNQTVIRMNVTGSDLYKNHVTCTGITECGCCILHAAGASDAVVDHVTINVTDALSGVHTLKEMVVIF